MKIVYESKTGHTKAYAEMLGEELNLPVYTLKDALNNVDEEEVIFLSWLYVEKIKKLDKAKKLNIKCVCAVGDMEPNDEYVKGLKERSNLSVPIFYLQGGIDLDKLNIFYRFWIKVFLIILKNRKDVDQEVVKRLSVSTNYVAKENLSNVIDYIKKS